MVKVTADGRGTVRSVVIDPVVFQEHDAEFLSDLVLTAVAEAQRRAAELLQAEMRKVPPLPFRAAVLTGECHRGADHRARQAAGDRPEDGSAAHLSSAPAASGTGRQRLASVLVAVSERVRPCEACGNLTEEQPCGICRDPRRDRGGGLRGGGAVHGRRGRSLDRFPGPLPRAGRPALAAGRDRPGGAAARPPGTAGAARAGCGR